MILKKTTNILQTLCVAAIFLIVLSQLIFNLTAELKGREEKKKVVYKEIDPEKIAFIKNVETHYNDLLSLYRLDKFDEAVAAISRFEKYGKENYKQLLEMKKKIPSRYKKKFRAILKYVNEKEYDYDFDIVVVIKSPLYGQLYFLTDLPVKFEADARSVDEDFSNIITWTSNLDGYLGKGREIEKNLSLGKHKVTAVCSDGLKDYYMSVVVDIEDPHG